jgi:hypothetical protein
MLVAVLLTLLLLLYPNEYNDAFPSSVKWNGYEVSNKSAPSAMDLKTSSK